MSDNKDLEKKFDLWWDASLGNKDNLKESFENLKNELNKLKNELNKLKNNINEWQENKQDKQNLENLDKEISNIDKKLEEEKKIEKLTWWEWKIKTWRELKAAKQIDDWLANNPWDANQWRAESALKLLEDIHWQLDPNRIAKWAQWIIQKLTK